MWVTNKLRQQRFVKDRLFPSWNVTCLAEWYWLKEGGSRLCCNDCNNNNVLPHTESLLLFNWPVVHAYGELGHVPKGLLW